MGDPWPEEGTLAYEVVKRALCGTRPCDIVRQTGISHQTVYWALRTARERGIAVPVFAQGRGLASQAINSLSSEIRTALQQAAFKRGESATALVAKLIAAAVRDGLIDAILDDGDDA